MSTIVKITLPDGMKSFTTSFYTACATNVRSGNQEKELEALLNNLKPTAVQLVEAYNGIVERILVPSFQVLTENITLRKLGMVNVINLKK